MATGPSRDAPDRELFWLASLDETQAGRESNHRLQLDVPTHHDVHLVDRGGLVLLLDGEIYDHAPLTHALGWGSEDRGMASPEILVTAYEQLGAGCFRLLYGEFAILVWEKTTETLVLARDPLGIRPLTYGTAQGRFVISPSPDLLVRAGVSGAFNRAGIGQWVLEARIDISETFYADVKRVPPGHLLELRRGNIFIRPYQTDCAAQARAGDADAHEEFDRLLRESVTHGLDSHRSSVLLSGGIDSAAVAAVLASQAAQLDQERPLALSLRFPDPRVDESDVQRTTAAALSLPLDMTSLDDAVGSDGVLGAGLRLSARSWMPPMNPWAAAYDELVRAGTRSGCRTVFTGEGGNELLEPSWDELFRLVENGRLAELRRAAAAWVDYVPTASEKTIVRLALRRGLVRSVRRAARHPRAHRVLAEALRRRVANRLPDWWLPDSRLRRAHAEKAAAITLRGESGGSLLENPGSVAALLEASHLQGRRLGVAVRHPYYDVRLFSFRAQLSLATVLYRGRFKGLGRETFERRAVSGAASVPRPHAVSVAGWFVGLLEREAPPALDRLQGLPNLERLGVVRRGVFAPERGARILANVGYYQCWHLLACEAWLSARSEGER